MTSLPLERPAVADGIAQTRRCFRLLLGIDALFLLYAVVAAALAPCGYWMNHLLGITLWPNGDPSASYVISSLHFLDPHRAPPFFGHPGLTLQLPIALVARGTYTIYHLFGGTEPFLQFWALRIRTLFLIGSIITALLHVVSFHVLYAFARRIVDDTRIALLAVLGYATAFATLFYAARISVEPILVATVLGTLLCLWDMETALADGNRKRAYRLAGLAGALSVAAIYTKTHLAGPLPAFVLFQLLFQRRNLRAKLVPAATFIAAAAIVFWIGTLRLDWNGFIESWAKHGLDQQAKPILSNADSAPTQQAKAIVGSITKSLRTYLPLYFRLDRHQGLFALAEVAFAALALAGLVAFWTTHKTKRRLVFWPVLYGLVILPIPLYRGYWHYLFLYFAFGAPFFAWAVWWAVTRLVTECRALPLAILAVVVVHSLAIFFAVESKWQDTRHYRWHVQDFHRALARCKPGDHVAVVVRRLEPWAIHGGPRKWTPGAADFFKIFDSQFIRVDSKAVLTPEFKRTNKIKAVVVRAARFSVLLEPGMSMPKGKSKYAKPATRPTRPPKPTTRRAPATRPARVGS